MHNDEIIFNEGEKRELTATVSSYNSKEVVVIASATFELKKQFGGEIVQEGQCEVVGSEAIVFLDLAEKGSYELEVTTRVGREEIIKKAIIKVV
jgi:hypothetical protein